MNFKKKSFLSLGLVVTLGISAASFATINNSAAFASESNSETVVATRTPSGWLLLTKYFKAHTSGVLQYGDTNFGIEGLNDLLLDYGYLRSDDYPDDSEEFTTATRAAVKELQGHLGITVTGKFTASDWKAVQNDYIN